MEDSQHLSRADKDILEKLKKELVVLKREHKGFAAKKGGVTPEERVLWKANAARMNEVYVAIKDMRHKNVLEAARGN